MDRVRFWIDKALAIEVGSDLKAWALAADGLQKVKEDRLDSARKAFAESRALSQRGRNKDEQYVHAYNALWLAIGDSEVGYQRIGQLGLEAHLASSGASRFLRMLLQLPSMDRLEDVCGGREAADRAPDAQEDSRKMTVDVSFRY